jgi:transposase
LCREPNNSTQELQQRHFLSWFLRRVGVQNHRKFKGFFKNKNNGEIEKTKVSGQRLVNIERSLFMLLEVLDIFSKVGGKVLLSVKKIIYNSR